MIIKKIKKKNKKIKQGGIKEHLYVCVCINGAGKKGKTYFYRHTRVSCKRNHEEFWCICVKSNTDPVVFIYKIT